MVGISGTSQTGDLHSYYSCKGKKDKKCKRKNIPKDNIEDLLIVLAINTLTDENIYEIANAVYETAYIQEDRTKLKRLKREILKLEKQKQNLVNSLSECDISEFRKSIFDQAKVIEERKVEVEKQLRIEENSQFNYTIPQIKAILNSLRKKENRNDIKYRKMIINSLIYKVYVYDTTLTILFNTQDSPIEAKMPDIEELEKSFKMSNSSYNGNNARPYDSNFQGIAENFKSLKGY